MTCSVSYDSDDDDDDDNDEDNDERTPLSGSDQILDGVMSQEC